MRSLKKVTMALASAAAFAAAGCGDLDVTNPNNPDVERVLSSRSDVISLAGSGISSWFLAFQHMDGGGPLNTMADGYSASWNNYNMRIFSSEPRQQWLNDLASTERTTVEQYWYDYYALLSSANDVVRATSNAALQWNEADSLTALGLGRLMQGIAIGEISLNYDKGFYADENSDLTSLEFIPRGGLRDSAVKLLGQAEEILGSASFETEPGWTGRPAGPVYTSAQLAELAATMAARVIAYHPRNRAELDAMTTAQWQQVEDLASRGLSYDFVISADGGCPDYDRTLSLCDYIKLWGEDPTSMRVDMRLAHMMDPALPSVYPGDAAAAAQQPNSPDRRLGDGTFGDGDDFGNGSNLAETADAGTDFVWVRNAIFRAERGLYHRSPIAHIRWYECGGSGVFGTYGGLCDSPIVTKTENDLLLAEAKIHLGELQAAADLINLTRVGRGELPEVGPTAGAYNAAFGEVGTGLYGALQYEQDIELLGLSVVPFYNRRRIDGLQPKTPHEFPVPAKELGVLGLPLYTFGGDFPLNSTPTAAPLAIKASSLELGSRPHRSTSQRSGFRARQF